MLIKSNHDDCEGYLLLTADEPVVEGDEFYSPELRKWMPSMNWHPDNGPEWTGRQSGGKLYRRKVSKDAK